MSSDTPATLFAEPFETAAEDAAPIAPSIARWGEVALTVLFLAAVLFASFLAVVTGPRLT